jgi:hypothetical protein
MAVPRKPHNRNSYILGCEIEFLSILKKKNKFGKDEKISNEFLGKESESGQSKKKEIQSAGVIEFVD